MKVLLLLTRCIYIAALLCNVQTDRRMFNDTQVSLMQELLVHYCPNHTLLTCNGDNVSKISTNACCTGCSCDQSCGLYGNCCYDEDDVYNLMEEGMMKCTFPYTGRPQPVLGNTMYKLIVGPPKGGCVAPGSCNKTTQLTTWETFFPVFSKVKKLSYITPDCAACHGVLDGTKWNSLVMLNNFKWVDLNEITDIVMARESDKIFVYFNHPGTDQEIMQSMCSTPARENCYPLNEESNHDFLSNFKTIFPHSHITFDAIKDGCYGGPYSPFLYRNILFKNLFCVMCYFHKPPTDRCIQYNFRSPHAGFSILIDSEFIDMAKKESLRKRILNSQIACKAGTKIDCRTVRCPTMQMRVKSGECKFLSTTWNLRGIHLLLNLTAPASMGDAESIFSNYSEHDVMDVLYYMTPWHKCWTINRAGIRSFRLRNKTMVEMFIEMACDMVKVSPATLKTSIQNVMSKVWIIKTNIGLLRFHQEFYKYGSTIPNGGVLIPKSVADGSVPSVVKTPRYREISRAGDNSLSTIAYMNINKLFFCHQIELKPHEYELRDVLRLVLQDKFMFRNEFKINHRLGNITIRLCLEDFGMELVPNRGRTGFISELLIIVRMFYTTLLQ